MMMVLLLLFLLLWFLQLGLRVGWQAVCLQSDERRRDVDRDHEGRNGNERRMVWLRVLFHRTRVDHHGVDRRRQPLT